MKMLNRNADLFDVVELPLVTNSIGRGSRFEIFQNPIALLNNLLYPTSLLNNSSSGIFYHTTLVNTLKHNIPINGLTLKPIAKIKNCSGIMEVPFSLRNDIKTSYSNMWYHCIQFNGVTAKPSPEYKFPSDWCSINIELFNSNRGYRQCSVCEESFRERERIIEYQERSWGEVTKDEPFYFYLRPENNTKSINIKKSPYRNNKESLMASHFLTSDEIIKTGGRTHVTLNVICEKCVNRYADILCRTNPMEIEEEIMDIELITFKERCNG